MGKDGLTLDEIICDACPSDVELEDHYTDCQVNEIMECARCWILALKELEV